MFGNYTWYIVSAYGAFIVVFIINATGAWIKRRQIRKILAISNNPSIG